MCPHSENDCGCIRNFEHRKYTKHALTGITRYLIILRNNKRINSLSKLSWLDRTAIRSNIFSKNSEFRETLMWFQM